MKKSMERCIMEKDCACIPCCRRLSPFVVVDYTGDDIAYNSHQVHQNPRAQRFYHLREHCIANNFLFEDPHFKVEDQPLFSYRLSTKSKLKWLRPKEIVEDPQFLANEPSAFDVEPGYIPSGSLRAAMLNLITNRRTFSRTVPPDNSFTDEQYAGIFHFRFWEHGRWLDVVIDDRLPTLDGRLLCTRSSRANELWCSLLEKAYAKFLGSYNALKGVTISETLQDFSGGVTQCYWLKEYNLNPDYFFELIGRGLSKGSMIAGIRLRKQRTSADRLCCIHPITETMTSGSKLVCLSHSCDRDIHTSPSENQSPSEEYEHPRKFWLCIEQFMEKFDGVEVCSITPDPLGDPDNVHRHWNVSSYEGMWVSGLTAGGSRNHKDSYGMNPRIKMDLIEPDSEAGGMCSLVISLMQMHRTGMILCLVIGFEIVSQKSNKTVAQSIYSNSREVSCRLRLPSGRYFIIPSTKQPDENGAFLLRIFTKPRIHQEDETDFNIIDPVQVKLKSGNWESMVRMFFDLANNIGLIVYSDAALIISAHFYDAQPKRKRKGWPFISVTESRPVELSANKKYIRSTYGDRDIQRSLTEHIYHVRPEGGGRLNFEQFLQLLTEYCDIWQQMFGLDDKGKK
ncbi:calpain-3-like [Armigeres subalbatus]|uniref:calpain-3-like n=1 Tax=Armigeres subalbatus TaxID=124917 RepID=UPI002ED01A78